MTIVSNFTVIQNDTVVGIGDAPAAPSWQKFFDTAGVVASEPAMLTLMVKGLTDAVGNVAVTVNNVVVGYIYPYNGADPDHWYANTINIAGINLINGQNTLLINAVGNLNPVVNNIYDNTSLRNVVCFFHVEV